MLAGVSRPTVDLWLPRYERDGHHHPPVHPQRDLRLGKVLISQIRDYLAHWNKDLRLFVWAATASQMALPRRGLRRTSLRRPLNDNSRTGPETAHLIGVDDNGRTDTRMLWIW